jgi:ribosome-binding protein aMBF1 (putative translation factor)
MRYVRRDPRVARGIRRVRLERGWTLNEVAALLCCDRSQISRIEKGERGLPDPEAVARQLGVSLSYLLMPCPRCVGKPPDGYLCLALRHAGR